MADEKHGHWLKLGVAKILFGSVKNIFYQREKLNTITYTSEDMLP